MALVTTIGAIVGIAAKGGWFAKAEFADEILGEWGDRGEASAGLVLDLENETGQICPELRRMRDEAIDEYSKFRNALPWNKGDAAKDYQERVQRLAQAIQSEAKAYQQTLGGIPGFENIVTNLVKSPFVIVTLVFLFVIGLILFTMTAKRSR